MGRLIFVPQYPAKMRYQEWWYDLFKLKFQMEYDQVVVLGESHLNYQLKNQREIRFAKPHLFSPIKDSIDFETAQINDYMRLNIRDDDTLFLADISFPGLFCNVLYHRPCPKMYAFCHATSLNKYDYFMPMRKYKKKIEFEHARLFDGIFFGSYYSMNKTNWLNRYIPCHVVNLPKPPKTKVAKGYFKKEFDIVSVCRPSIQKVNKKVEKKVERALGIKIHRQEVSSWAEYSALLSKSKVLLITTKEDTFNYTIMDAIRCGCVPIVPDTLCFPEILPKYWRYDNVDHLIVGLNNMFVDDQFVLPEMICEDRVNNFFPNIIGVMKNAIQNIL